MNSRSKKIAVIAGATRGIGLALVRALARAWQPADQIYLTARRPQDGESERGTWTSTFSSTHSHSGLVDKR